jgi:hypothetical protein
MDNEHVETSPRPQTKIVVVLRDDLAGWQAVNVTAFLVSGLSRANPEVIGADYRDADGVTYLPMFRQPVLALSAGAQLLTAVHGRALSRGIALSIFTADLFATGNDVDNRAAVEAVPTAKLDLVGLVMYGPKNQVDKVVKGASMYR